MSLSLDGYSNLRLGGSSINKPYQRHFLAELVMSFDIQKLNHIGKVLAILRVFETSRGSRSAGHSSIRITRVMRDPPSGNAFSWIYRECHHDFVCGITIRRKGYTTSSYAHT